MLNDEVHDLAIGLRSFLRVEIAETCPRHSKQRVRRTRLGERLVEADILKVGHDWVGVALNAYAQT